MAGRLKSRIAHFMFEGVWLDGLRLFVSYGRNWLAGSLVLVGLQIYLDVYAYHFDSDWVVIGGQIVLDSISLYFFCVCFLNQEPVKGVVQTTRHMFLKAVGYWFVIQVVLVACLLLAGIATLSTMGIFAWPIGFVGWAFRHSASSIFYLIATARFIGVVPFVISGMANPLATSIRVTRGQSLRVTANLLLLLTLAGPFAALLIHLHAIIGGAIAVVLVQGLFAAYACAVARILNGEYIAASLGADRRGATRA